MIGNMIAKVREEKGITKTELARLTNINIGHLTHIEKGERNPSHKALKNICKALDIPYQPLMYTYDKTISDTQENYGSIDHISYNRLLAVDNINSFIECPSYAASASLAIKIPDESMMPKLSVGSYAFIEFNSLLNNNDIGLFEVDGQIIFRKFFNKKGVITLKAENPKFPDIVLNDENKFYIIGKVLNK